MGRTLRQWARHRSSGDWLLVMLGVAVFMYFGGDRLSVISKEELGGDRILKSGHVERLRNAIARQESGGNSAVVNVHSGAAGLLQVMPENVEPWTLECLGRSLSVEEFRASKSIQIAVGDCKLEKYWAIASQYTDDEEIRVRMVAAAWYGGEGSMKLYDDPRKQPYRDPKTGVVHYYPSFQEYTTAVWDYYQEHGQLALGAGYEQE